MPPARLHDLILLYPDQEKEGNGELFIKGIKARNFLDAHTTLWLQFPEVFINKNLFQFCNCWFCRNEPIPSSLSIKPNQSTHSHTIVWYFTHAQRTQIYVIGARLQDNNQSAWLMNIKLVHNYNSVFFTLEPENPRNPNRRHFLWQMKFSE